MNVDGKLDEPQWAEARVFSDFRLVEPLTLVAAPHATELRLLALPDALYVGLRAEHAPGLRTHGRSPRDAKILDADPAILMIDFEGLGKTAYEFTISLSGSKRDSIVLNQTTLSRDWDADWDAAVHEDPAGWSVEWRIPWLIAPEGPVHDGQRTIGIYASRYLKHDGQRYALPAIEYLSPNFVRDFQRLEIPHYSGGDLALFPYASFTHDTLTGGSKGRAGFDVFWKPNGHHQLSAAVNPDFGQVESDNLVVNFSPIETFFEEKRPFFTQGQQLFDLGAAQHDRLVNTRRIGAAPDAGPELASDVLAAGKYTGISGNNEYGLFAAQESDSSQARGRRFVAARWRYAHDGFGLGYLGTGTQRPTLARNAYLHSVDYSWRWRPTLLLSGQALMSMVSDGGKRSGGGSGGGSGGTGGTAGDPVRGLGAWAQLDYQPGTRWQQKVRGIWYDRHLDFNDLGYQERADMRQLLSDTNLYIRHYRTGSWADNGSWYLGLNLPYNTRGERLVATAELNHEFAWRNGADSVFFYIHEWPGFDDLLTRGNGSLRMPQRHNWGADYSSPVRGKFRYYVQVVLHEEGFTDLTRELKFEPKWFPSEHFSASLQFDLNDSPNWLVWANGRRVAVYQRHDLLSAVNLNWYPTGRQELRLKFQWLGLGAQAVQAYEVGSDGTPLPVSVRPADFTLSTVGLQLRYRYEFKPQSELYVVYSRGGDGSLDDRSESLGQQLRRSLDQTTASLLFVKLRYRL
jgi:hypothetical protein